MSLSSFFQRFGREQSAGPAATLSAAEVARVRQQAKRRLIGMTVLVVIAVLLLSWLLETEPRQGPRDVRIDVAASATTEAQTVVPLLEPTPRPAIKENDKTQARSVPPPPATDSEAPLQASLADDEEVVNPKPKAVAPAKPAAPKPVVAPPAVVKPVPPVEPAVKAVKKPVDQPIEKATPKARYVVQIGAFADVTLARQARLKVEKLGFKTYTQVITTDKGRTIRVRVGPYADEAEARHAVASIRLAGMTAGLLTL